MLNHIERLPNLRRPSPWHTSCSLLSCWAALASRIRTCSECERHCRPATTSTWECCRGALSTRPSPSPSAGVGAARRSRPGCGPRRVRCTCPCSTAERRARSSVASQNGILWCWFRVQRTALAGEGKIGGLPTITFFLIRVITMHFKS